MRLSPILFVAVVVLMGLQIADAKAAPSAGPLNAARQPFVARSPLASRVGPAPPAFFDMLGLSGAKSR